MFTIEVSLATVPRTASGSYGGGRLVSLRMSQSSVSLQSIPCPCLLAVV
ncbi:hypothetical protein A2U01_0070736, partial [Trifolium medium]|nr:hypothetical protein [Trifolium medium]